MDSASFTDRASVLMEAIGYIGFLHAQIHQALTSPYFHNTTTSPQQQHSLTVHGLVETNSVFPEDPGQLLNNNEHGGGLKRKGEDSSNKDLFFKTRAFCLLPISFTQHLGNYC
ncbi:hypothetical protein PIB30_012310 [Stylosanthes scabra]|uniref:BHLH domain-containing protein n=1 Tax=Stylosanthes scabra TaxID=79078 RepID=A0ABU6Y6B6_9FABA|nr:hypothetical protein [Stylosanthes scabra]